MAEIKLTQGEIETLYMCRNKAREVARLEERVNAPLPIRSGLDISLKYSGIPGVHDPHGLDGSSRKNEAEFQALERERDALESLSEQAMRIICTLDHKMHDFCVAYFLRGEDMDTVAASIKRDRTTCWRKLQRLRGGDGNGSFRRREMKIS